MAPKKLSKKEKARLEAEAAETARLEMERERIKKLEEEKMRQIHEKKEAEKRQHQEVLEHKLRKKQLKETIEYLIKLKKQIRDLRREEKIEREWGRYMRCNNIPNTKDPSDLRQYIYMWLQEIDKREKAEMNWLLQTNEQSVLTQDQTIPNMSYEYLRNKQPILGDYYAKRLEEVLGILKELDTSIHEEGLSESIMQELHNLQCQLRIMVSDFLNDFSYKILLNIKRDMDLEGLNIASHKFNSARFKNQIYTTLDTPTPIILNPKEKTAYDARHIELDFQELGVQIVLPSIIKCKRSAIRALWIDFDHYSDYCRTINLPYVVNFSKNIRQTTKGEWKKRKEILKMVLEEILSDKPQPEDAPDAPDEAATPPKILDVDKIYTDYEDEIRKDERRKKGPESLRLPEIEVNLRSHRITGGVYHFNYVEQPEQHVKLGPKAYLRTIQQPAKLIMKDWHQLYMAPPVPEPGVRRLPEEIEAELKMVEENLDKLALVTLQLPETVFWFEPPVICRWEPITHSTHRKVSISNFRRQKPPAIKIVEDFNLIDIPDNSQLQSLIADFVIPKIPDGYGVKLSRVSLERFKSALDPSPILQEAEISPQLTSLIYETRAPSFLHPTGGAKRILQVVSSKGYSEYSESFNNEETDTSEIKDQEHVKPEITENVYMFSKFMQDLDELIDSKRPIFDRKTEEDEMDQEQEMQQEEEGEEKVAELTEAELALLKLGADFDVGTALLLTREFGLINKKEEKPPEEEPDVDSEDDYDELVEDLPCKPYRSKRIEGRWITDDIHDIKYNEDKLQLQFRIGKLGTYALASPRYSNIPFQGWDLKPDLKNPSVLTFSITASIMSAEFTLSAEGVRLNSIQGGATNALNDFIGITYPIRQMIKLMRSVSADIFPDDDAFYYVDGSCEKNSTMEYHLYNCIGTMVATHNFGWSRWNIHAGSRTVVILMREIIEHRKIPHFSTVHVTPLKACIVDCTEVGAAFSAVPVSGMKYYADLHQLNVAITPQQLLEKQEKIDPRLRDNTSVWLKSIRPLSFS